MRRQAALAALCGTLAGCGSLPWMNYGEPPLECADFFAPNTRLEWAGSITPRAAMALGIEARDGGLFVGPANQEMFSDPAIPDLPIERAFCAVYPDGSSIAGPLPEGWQPP